MAKNLLVDTGFWFALYDSRDSLHEDAQILADLLDQYNLVLPWPCLYETLKTRFVKRRHWLDGFFSYANHANTVRLSDEAYRDDALRKVFKSPTPWLSLSLVDWVIRLALDDRNTKIDAMVTFNRRDFWDICLSRHIELIPG
jgi:predicted nucleic acid-binding protein